MAREILLAIVSCIEIKMFCEKHFYPLLSFNLNILITSDDAKVTESSQVVVEESRLRFCVIS